MILKSTEEVMRAYLIAFLTSIFVMAGTFSVMAANQIFNTINQSTPLNTMQSMMDAIKDCHRDDITRCRELRRLCHPEGDNDVWKICSIALADETEREEIFNFVTSLSLGAEVTNGDLAIVHFTFGIASQRRHEYMKMLFFNGKWHLESF